MNIGSAQQVAAALGQPLPWGAPTLRPRQRRCQLQARPWHPSQRPRRGAPPPPLAAAGASPSPPSPSSSSASPAADLDALLYDSEVPLARLQARLEAAVEAEDYDLAAQLRDVLQRRRFDARLAVEEANERFYAAFQSGSLAGMGEVWGKGEHVQCIHPLSGCIAGRQAVMESWKMILGAARMRISLEDVRVYATDSHGYVTCVEVTESSEGRGRIAATNIFERQGGSWKMVMHHGSPAPR